MKTGSVSHFVMVVHTRWDGQAAAVAVRKPGIFGEGLRLTAGAFAADITADGARWRLQARRGDGGFRSSRMIVGRLEPLTAHDARTAHGRTR